MNRKLYFIKIFKKAEKKYSKYEKRLAGEGWKEDWQTLIATIMSAQSRDETTLPVAEVLFKKYRTLESLSKAEYEDVLHTIKRINYNRTKAKNIIAAAKYMVNHFQRKVPSNIDELIKIPGVGRKTANLVLSEVYNKDSICVDTHVHRISNALGLVNTKNPEQTEFELMKIAPKRYWKKINRIFVLWGKDVFGRDKKKILAKLE